MKRTRKTSFILVAAFASLGALGQALTACSQAGSADGAPAPAPASSAAATTQALAPTTAPAAGGHGAESEWGDSLPTEKFADGAKAFAAAKQAMLSAYYDKGLTEDDLYRAATRGMLEHVDPSMQKWNKLISPSELSALKNDLKGEIVGVGVEIKFDDATGYTDVLGVVPGSPADKAGVVAGDTIVTVNGKLYKGKTIHDVVQDIRGKVGDTVTLSVLRGDKLLSMPLVRQLVTYDAVTHFDVTPQVGYLRIRHFSEKTPGMLKAALDDFAKRNMKGLIVDMRDNGGGSFDDAIASAEQFLTAGTTIVSVDKRGNEEKIVSKGQPVLASVPVAVVVDHNTASSAELLTAALQEGRHAVAVGGRTFGKWSVQKLDDLPNGYALKFTVGIFKTGSGKTYGGVGLTPDIEIAMDDKAFARVCMQTDPATRLAADPPLRTALSMLSGQIK